MIVLDLFPQLDHQKRVIAKSMKKQKNRKHKSRSRSKSRLINRSKSPESYSRNRFKKSRSRSGSRESQCVSEFSTFSAANSTRTSKISLRTNSSDESLSD